MTVDIALDASSGPAPLVHEKRLEQALATLNPRGRGAIGEALLQAASNFTDKSLPATIVLTADDAGDNCQSNICEVAEKLRAENPELVIHTVGLGMKADDVAKLSCLATTTGGIFRNVTNSDQLDSALAEAFDAAAARRQRGSGQP